VTAIEAVYVPADDFTDPAVGAISTHVDSMVVLSRQLASEGIYPAIDPISTTSVLLDAQVVGEEHVRVAGKVREAIEHYRELRDVIALLGVEELGAEERILVARARKLQRFLTQPFFVAAAYTGMEGRSVTTADTVAGCRAILEGECDDWEEDAFYMIGTLDEAREKAARRQGTARKPGPAPAAPATAAPAGPARQAR
ncbi:MAG: F0F1 ATP synthase subunit beta, partial [Oceanibaculum nanhaiense]|nr:F0F1 ATP synthase subunit beta [Oceanibaculum nanhaiense]